MKLALSLLLLYATVASARVGEKIDDFFKRVNQSGELQKVEILGSGITTLRYDGMTVELTANLPSRLITMESYTKVSLEKAQALLKEQSFVFLPTSESKEDKKWKVKDRDISAQYVKAKETLFISHREIVFNLDTFK